jgi:O-antigen/teichoic acid export membrane protein
MVHSTVNLFTAFAGFRLGSTSTKYIAEFRESDPAKAGRILGLVFLATFGSCGLLALIMLAMSGWLGAVHLKTPELSVPIAIGSAFLFLMMVGNVLLRTLAGFEDFKGIAVVGFVRGIASLLVCIPLTYFWGLNGAIVGMVIISAIAAVQTVLLVRSAAAKHNLIVPFRWNEVSKELSIISAFAIPAMLTGFLLVATAWQGRAVLLQSSNGKFELGVFSAADQFRLIILFLPNAIGNVLLPMLSKSHGEANKDEFERGVGMNIQLIYRLAMPAALFGIATAIPLATVFGPEFAVARDVIPIVMLAVFVYSMNQAVRQAFTATAKVWVNCFMHLIWAIVFVVGCYYLIPKWGAIGFAWVHVIADGILLLLQLSYTLLCIVQINRWQYVRQVGLGIAIVTAIVLIGQQFGIVAQTITASVALVVTTAPSVWLVWKSKNQFRLNGKAS